MASLFSSAGGGLCLEGYDRCCWLLATSYSAGELYWVSCRILTGCTGWRLADRYCFKCREKQRWSIF